MRIQHSRVDVTTAAGPIPLKRMLQNGSILGAIFETLPGYRKSRIQPNLKISLQ